MKSRCVLRWLAVVLAAGGFAAGCRARRAGEPAMRAPETVAAPQIDPWKEAALKVEEDRGEKTGRQAEAEVPLQLKHYSDRRRFLAIQAAAWREDRFSTPHDFAELAALVRRGELVEAPALGEDFILYGVGENASDAPFTHYDRATGKSVTLFASDAELGQEHAQIDEQLKELDESARALEGQSKELPKKEREARARLREEIEENRRDAKALRERKKLLDGFYRDEKKRAMLAAEYEELAALARDFAGKSFDLNDPASRKEFKVRLLSFVRPAALKVIEEVARSYRQKFERRLPITSLVRTDEYQRQLSTVNPNATLAEIAPHTTGLAFDVYYRYMTADEQAHVMTDLARLRDERRVEALRERRDHYHVFAFAEGRPPEEELVQNYLGGDKKPPAPEAKATAKKKSTKAAARKPPARKTAARPQKNARKAGAKRKR